MLPVIKIISTKQKHSFLSGHIVLFFLAVLGYQISFAQLTINNNHKENYRAVLWSSTDGLSLGKKNAMLKDVNGFLWIISPMGLNRFDGSNFKIYYTDKNTPGTIDGFYSFSLVEDSLHNIWIGTNKGLSRYDIKNDTIKNFSTPVLSVTSVASIIPFWATRDELYCIEAGYRVTVYNIHSFKKKILATLDKNRPAINNITSPQSIYDAGSNSIWILTGEYGVPGGGLLQIKLSEKKVLHYEWPCNKKIPDHAHYSYGMRYDSKRNSIWINSVEGLLEFTLLDKQFHGIAACNELMNLDNYEMIAGIELDRQGKVLLYRYTKGIIIYDPIAQTVQPLFSDPDLQHKVSDENMSIYCDREGMIWCGYLPVKGIYQLIPFSSSVTRMPIYTSQPINRGNIPPLNMTQADHGQIWLSMIDGLNIFDPVSSSLKRLRQQDFPGLKGQTIIPLGMDSIHQKAWLHTWNPGTFYEMDIQTRTCRKIHVKDMNHREISNIYPNYNNISPYNNGFIFLVDKTGIFTVTSDSAVAQQVLEIPYHITNIAVAAGKRIFLRLHFANRNVSYYETNGKWVQTATALDSIEWSCIFYDTTNQSYWAGGLKQLYHIDKDFKLIRRYNDKDGLSGIDVLSIIKDNLGNIWFNSSQGQLSRVNEKTGILTVLSEKDGYKKQEFLWQTPHFKDWKGDLYFAGTDGIDRISPNKLDLFPPSIVYLQSLEVNQKPFPLTTGINNLKSLSLKYFQTAIMIETGVIDYYSKGRSSIRYKLEGLNDNWQYAPANYTIRFERLLPRKYKLVIQASSSGNNFNGPEKILMINVSPSFWNTWWFYILAGMVVLTGIYILFRYRLRQKISLLEMRNRISQDLHDEIGASISGINLLSQMAVEKLQNNKPDEASEYLFKVKNYTQDVIEKLSDMVWIFSPQNDSIEKLLERLKWFAISIAVSKNIKIHFVTDKETEIINLTIRQRKAIYLLSKEAINNIFKYAACSNIYYSLHAKGSRWHLQVQDDGKGFVHAENKNGNGLRNMQARANEIGANFNIQSQTGVGTIITVEF